jgi:predicted CoA-substrate-specific enzyme activase
MDKTYFAGVDAGATFIKTVIVSDGLPLAGSLTASRGDYAGGVAQALEQAAGKLGLKIENISKVVATGLGASRVAAAESATEATCIAAGVHVLFPTVRTIIDIGAQSTRIIKVNNEGQLTNFVASDKCAAGSGRFLQVIARVLRINLDDIGELSLKSSNPAEFSTSCAVFAESEAVTRLSQGATKEDILAGVHLALARKITSMLVMIGLTPDCVVVGGGAKDTGLVRSLEETAGTKLLVPQEPQMVAAFGAALVARTI